MTQRFNSMLKRKKIDIIIYQHMVRYLKQKKLMPDIKKIAYFWETNYEGILDPMATMYLLYKSNQLDGVIRNWAEHFNEYQFKL